MIELEKIYKVKIMPLKPVQRMKENVRVFCKKEYFEE
jgi:hypothetical protein